MKVIAILVFILYAFTTVSSQGWFFNRGERPPIDGGWTSWGNWSVCFKNTNKSSLFYPPWNDFSVSYRNRSCTSPSPANGGKNCYGGETRLKQCGCKNQLGMSNGKILSQQLSSSPFLVNHSPNEGRLTEKNNVWCSKDTSNFMLNIYYEIDLMNLTQISGISIAGSLIGRVKQFKLRHSVSRDKWQLYKDQTYTGGVIDANLYSPSTERIYFEENIVARYVRIYPTAMYSKYCMSLELHGCAYTCGSVYNSTTGEIKAKSLPNLDQDCVWKIEVPQKTSITLDFVVIDLPCEDASLVIRDGTLPFFKSNIIANICGEEALPLVLSTNSLWISFKSSSSSPEVGFTLNYQTDCGHEIKLQEGQTTNVQSTNFPRDYYHHTDCSWIITGSPGTFIEFDFQVLDIEGSSSSDQICKNDRVLILTLFDNGTEHTVHTLCNTHKSSLSILVPSHKAKISFKTDGAISGQGFKASVTAVVVENPIPTSVNVFIPTTNTKSNTHVPNVPSKGTESSTQVSQTETDPGEKNSPTPETLPKDSKPVKTPKRQKGRDDQWTTILIGTFSGIVLLLVATVLAVNLKKVLGDREPRTVIMTTPSYPVFGKKPEEARPEHVALVPKSEGTVAISMSPKESSSSNAEKQELIAKPDCLETDNVQVSIVDVIDEDQQSVTDTA